MRNIGKSLVIFALLAMGWGQLPLVVVPGLGDACNNPISMVPFCKQLGGDLKNPVHCLDPAGGPASIFTSWPKQITKLCELLDQNAEAFKLKGGFYIMGLSQGGLLARAAVESCDVGAYAKKLITFGGPHMGVIRVPHTSNTGLGWVVNLLTDKLVYTSLVQDWIGPAGYFHSLAKEDVYLHSKSPLPDLNNERNHTNNDQYKARLASLSEFVMVEFSQDTMVIPKETAHFGFYKDKSEKTILAYNQTSVYEKVGLDQLDKKKALFFYSFEGDHLTMTQANMEKYIYPHLDQK